MNEDIIEEEDKKNRAIDLQYLFFFVGSRPLCLWETDIFYKNHRFIDSIDPGYFEYLCDIHSKSINDKENLTNQGVQHAALALRTAYSQSIETLFALIFASIQAPWCVPAWMNSYKNHELRNLVESVQNEQPIISRLDTDSLSWLDLYDALFPGLESENTERTSAMKAGFSRVWKCFAHDFLSEQSNREYNSIKHGLRIQSGGFEVRIGIPKEPGVRPEEADMLVLTSSPFGSRYLKSEKVGGEAHNLRMVGESRNWDIESLIWGIQLAAMSIENIKRMLKALIAEGATQITLKSPSDLSDFGKWKGFADITDPEITIPPQSIYPFTKEEICENYNSGKYFGIKRP